VIDRRTTLQWMLAVSASLPLARPAAAPLTPGPAVAGTGYGSDPDLTHIYRPGEVWPLTLTPAQRRTAATLCDLILPAAGSTPSATAAGVVDFLDEWVSAPYPRQRTDRDVIIAGLAWMDAEAGRRFGRDFAGLEGAEQRAICDDICYLPRARPELAEPARFFARYRDLTAGAYYSTAAGRQDLGYVGNVPLPRFEGPPHDLLARLGLPDEL